jgi:hypothetical protein
VPAQAPQRIHESRLVRIAREQRRSLRVNGAWLARQTEFPRRERRRQFRFAGAGLGDEPAVANDVEADGSPLALVAARARTRF